MSHARERTLARHAASGAARAGLVVVALMATTVRAGVGQTQAARTGTVSGFVFDTTVAPKEGRVTPVVGADVTVIGTRFTTRTDTAGGFTLSGLPTGDFVIRIRHDRYDAAQRVVSIVAGTTIDVIYTLLPATHAVRAGRTIASSDRNQPFTKLTEFEQRRRQGFGTFITRDDIIRQQSPPTIDLMRRITGVRVVDSIVDGIGAPIPLVVSSRGAKLSMSAAGTLVSAPCVLNIVIDDVPMPEGFSVEQIDVHDIGGIEVYPGAASIPARFRSMGGSAWCGVVAFWTRDGT